MDNTKVPCVLGKPVELLPGVVRIVAPNPSIMTGPGTNTYLVGEQQVVVIDPGPDDETHLAAIERSGGGRISTIALTHRHLDHAEGARKLQQMTGAQIVCGEGGGGIEHVPSSHLGRFDVIGEGDLASVGGFPLAAVRTPGHSSDHLCYILDTAGLRILFSGDHLMQGSTVVIMPPDGNMSDYMRSLRDLTRLYPSPDAIAPGHGTWMESAVEVIEWFIRHREDRRDAVVKALTTRGSATVDDLLPTVYSDVGEVLRPMARYSLWAHLRQLVEEGQAITSDPENPTGRYSAVSVQC